MTACRMTVCGLSVRTMTVRGVVTWAVFSLMCGSTSGELTPDEIAIIAMAQSRESLAVAKYYAAARGIPTSHVCVIDGKPNRTLPRSEWDQNVRPSIQRWILAHKLETKLRCLVTVWDVPLTIGRQSADAPSRHDRTTYLHGEQQVRAERLIELIRGLHQLPAHGQRSPTPWQPQGASVDYLTAELQEALRQAEQRAAALPNSAKGRDTAVWSLQQAVLVGGGLHAILQAADRAASRETESEVEMNAKTQSQMDVARGRLVGLREGQAALQAMPPSVPRDERLLWLTERSEGLVGTLKWIEAHLELLRKNETYAAFDSELSLLFWPEYQLDRWQPNVLHYRFDGSRERWLKATLMVSRLEAPTVQLTTSLIDMAKATEQRGLRGNVYLDARGVRKPLGTTHPGSYADYDLSIQTLAADLKRHTSLNVVLDTEGRLFQAGDCPEAAIYCGWYSLGKYMDAFDWVPGSVGYHIASAEARTLRDPKSQVWCKRMLEDGVCATLGPVHEPYLASFPRPDEFFLLLMSGQYTLAEAYYRTKPYNSWVMVLVGDPLYNPLKNNPQLNTESIPEAWRPLFGRPSTQAPGSAGGT